MNEHEKWDAQPAAPSIATSDSKSPMDKFREQYDTEIADLKRELQTAQDYGAACEETIQQLQSEIGRLRRNVGCARQQGTTQFCGEAVDAHKRIAELETKLHALQLVCGTENASKFQTWLDRANRRIAELEQDCKRLDWLATKDVHVATLAGTPILNSCHELYGNAASDFHEGEIRAAIDAAMKINP